MRKLCAALTLVVVLSGGGAALAKDKESSKKSEPLDKKRKVYDKIVDTIESNKLNDEEKKELEAKGKERMSHLLDVYAEKAHLSDEEKGKLKEKFAHRSDAPKKEMPPELKEKLDSTFGDFNSFSKDMGYQVMSDHFDEKDLQAISKFLSSSTGKKLIKGIPDMIGQSVELCVEHYMQALVDFSTTLRRMAPPMMMPKQKMNPEMMEKLKDMMQKMQHPKLPSGQPGGDI